MYNILKLMHSVCFTGTVFRNLSVAVLIGWILSGDINGDVKITISTAAEKKEISPYIYGCNFRSKNDDFQDANVAIRRLGGNRSTGYNWENNASNAGSDWKHQSDGWLGEMDKNDSTGATLTLFHNQSIERGANSFITLQACGYVAKDKNGPVSDDEIAPSKRWAKVIFEKSAPFSLEPDKTDSVVYTDELINFLLKKYGDAGTKTGVKGYIIDNEPSLWPSTHSKMHPNPVTCEELISKTVSLSKVIKKMDNKALVIGPSLYGPYAYLTLQNAPDWKLYRSKYKLFVRYYLDQMRLAEEKEGKRLLDVLDIHWYPSAKGKVKDGTMQGIHSENVEPDVSEMRMQAPRALWDPEFKSDGWIALVPDMLRHIESYYPGTRLGFGEFSYGGITHISGGVAIADVLGIFGKYGVYFATYWGSSGTFVNAAYRIYRNYDGKKATFGEKSVDALASDKLTSSVYASLDSKNNQNLHIIIINKSDSVSNAEVSISGDSAYTRGKVWGFDKTSDQIKELAPVTKVSKGTFFYGLPALSVLHFVLEK